jgi:signal transduction histidine kinase
MPHFEFSVDAALLRELGERLVGQPHIALSELIKNSYDADAHHSTIQFGHDTIIVTDDGDGMSTETFRDFWMRVGSPHKQEILATPLGRRPTGSKGIGRLAVQFLGTKLELRTTPREATDIQLVATLDWSIATQAQELTKARVEYVEMARTAPYADGKPHGTEIRIGGLNQVWGRDELIGLAQQVWQLQPPFRREDSLDFAIKLSHPDPEIKEAFDVQLGRNLDIWSARIRGRLLPPRPGDLSESRRFALLLEFAGEDPERHEYLVPNCPLHKCDYEIRIFSLYHKQRYGVQVEEARKYLKAYGGVHIYDAGFHLPYYGPDTDWLKTEIDHSHRLSSSKLLPDELQVERALNNLPTISRLYGVVNVSTGGEREAAITEGRQRLNDYLQIQASRDRLVDNPSYRALCKAVRYALDFYAVRQTARMAPEPIGPGRIGEVASARVRRVEEVLESYREQIPTPIYAAVATEVREAVKASETEAENAVKQMGLLGALATAGIAALAYEHEANKQMIDLEAIAEKLASGQSEGMIETGNALREWIKRARQTRALFAPLNDAENREHRAALRARPVLEMIYGNVAPLLGPAEVSIAIPDDLRLPEGTVAEWSAIFQNVLINAANAMLDSPRHRIDVRADEVRGRHVLLVQDTGAGVDLTDADSLFQPFSRRLEISADRRELGLGGTGLGLAIVRMVANNLNCRVRFTEPSSGYATAFELSWR